MGLFPSVTIQSRRLIYFLALELWLNLDVRAYLHPKTSLTLTFKGVILLLYFDSNDRILVNTQLGNLFGPYALRCTKIESQLNKISKLVTLYLN